MSSAALATLTALRQRIVDSKFVKQPVLVYNCRGARGQEFQNPNASTCFNPTVDAASEAATAAGHEVTAQDRLAYVTRWSSDLVKALVTENHEMNRAVGCCMGLYIGDATGAPLEFIDTDNSLPPYPRSREASLGATLNAKGQLAYEGEYNKFGLARGQWTDDASMSGCLADSLLVRKDYHGGDCRVRYFWWWFFGYNNAFRLDTSAGRRSVGLGGNIAKSIDEIYDFLGKTSEEVPPTFTATGEDAGNGSMMRNAPVPVRFHSDVRKALDVAAQQSFATHPGPDAAACCQFMTYFCIQAIKRPADDATPITQFIDTIIEAFKTEYIAANPSNTGMQRLKCVLDCTPPGPTEQSWLWRNDVLPTVQAVQARGRRYNGYPVDAGYFGAYSMDGLSMSLWALRRSGNFEDTMLSVVNLLGDCDTTGAIAGQMAGAFYGLQHIESTTLSQTMIANVRRWDPTREVELRAAMLYVDGM